MSALQAAARHAQEGGKPIDLGSECNAVGLDPAMIQSVIADAVTAPDGRVASPGLADLSAGLVEDLSAMVRAVEAGAPSEGRTAAGRLAAIKAEGLLEPANEIAPARIAKLTGIPEDGGDSLHRLVMDLHKALNRLAAGCAEEGLAGAHVFGLRARGSARGRGIHARCRSHPRVEIRPSRARHHGDALRFSPRHPERHRSDRCACGRDCRRRLHSTYHLYRRPFGARQVFCRPVRRIPGRVERARSPAGGRPRRRRRVLSRHRSLRGQEHRRPRTLSSKRSARRSFF